MRISNLLELRWGGCECGLGHVVSRLLLDGSNHLEPHTDGARPETVEIERQLGINHENGEP